MIDYADIMALEIGKRLSGYVFSVETFCRTVGATIWLLSYFNMATAIASE
jgi:hypothetical protein